MQHAEEEEQQLLGVLLAVVVELWKDGAQRGPGLDGGAAGAAAHPHLLQQARKRLHQPAFPPAWRAKRKGENEPSWLSGARLPRSYLASSASVSRSRRYSTRGTVEHRHCNTAFR